MPFPDVFQKKSTKAVWNLSENLSVRSHHQVNSITKYSASSARWPASSAPSGHQDHQVVEARCENLWRCCPGRPHSWLWRAARRKSASDMISQILSTSITRALDLLQHQQRSYIDIMISTKILALGATPPTCSTSMSTSISTALWANFFGLQYQLLATFVILGEKKKRNPGDRNTFLLQRISDH